MKDENLFDWQNWKGTVNTDLPIKDQGTPKDEEAKKGYYFMRMPNLETLHCYENDKIKRIFIGDKAPKLKDLRIGLQHLASIGHPYTNEWCICYVEYNAGRALYDKSWLPPENENICDETWTTDKRIEAYFYVEP